ncbi:MAG: TetR family transcriptional regulator [Mesorhizobium sp.]|nr:TetR/AcrR family transcriptional regulator [Mesorhizobium sp. M1A.F.Ca.IN.022.06.1.1]RUV24302.1 TetR/AcrR family transcriptional regulator [Mesorhizobium sp. M1A.F.Ca.IN.022.04.1.1]RUV59193.1 TetR/AcrR family transcriptional regulator [Mesorhizobium sp. M1A.F.Ca.IN.022.02.1.1]RUV73447.1 TetR/AcrR family transcriptional regulator [Mesorhizobium sp. M1A.F.Ca.IN.020.30.1.1]RWG04766.1 MAG: TetR/AcrR family transcriptional regulator [Mesorhizobium sp.]
MTTPMPKLWNDTIEAHRDAVATTIVNKTAELAAAEGLHNLTMARIAKETGIGRATLYKYFSEVEQILVAWHAREVSTHLAALDQAGAKGAGPLAALEAVLLAYAENARRGHGHAFAALLHSMPHARHAYARVEAMVAELIAEAMNAGEIEDASPAAELARYALAAIAAAQQARSKPKLERLLRMILRGLGSRSDSQSASR